MDAIFDVDVDEMGDFLSVVKQVSLQKWTSAIRRLDMT
jgi:hypothetical protein